MIKLIWVSIALSLLVFSPRSIALTLEAGHPAALAGSSETETDPLEEYPRVTGFLVCFKGKFALNMNWQTYPTMRLFRLLELGELDMIYPLRFNSERSARFIQSLPAGTTHSYLVYTASRPVLEDKSLIVGAKRGTPQVSDFESRGFQSIYQTNDYSPLFKMLINGRLDAIAVPQTIYESYVVENDDKLNFHKHLSYDYGFYLKPTMDQGLIKMVNAAIMECSS